MSTRVRMTTRFASHPECRRTGPETLVGPAVLQRLPQRSAWPRCRRCDQCNGSSQWDWSPAEDIPEPYSNQSSGSTNLCRTKVSIIASRSMDRCGSQSAISFPTIWSRNWRSASKHSASVSDDFSRNPVTIIGGAGCSSSPASEEGSASVSGAPSSAEPPTGSVGSASPAGSVASVTMVYSERSTVGLRLNSSSFSRRRVV